EHVLVDGPPHIGGHREGGDLRRWKLKAPGAPRLFDLADFPSQHRRRDGWLLSRCADETYFECSVRFLLFPAGCAGRGAAPGAILQVPARIWASADRAHGAGAALRNPRSRVPLGSRNPRGADQSNRDAVAALRALATAFQPRRWSTTRTSEAARIFQAP